MRWGVLILLGVFFVSFASAVIPDDCESSMIAYWQFEDNVLDSYGGHDGGVWTGSEGYGTIVNKAALFDGSNKITIPNAADLDLDSAFTIEMWVRNTNPVSGVLFEKGDYKINWAVNIPFPYVNVTIGDLVLTSSSLGFNTNYHVAVVWDSSGSKLNLYVNGANVSEVVFASAADAAGNLIVGDGFTGMIDELAIYDSALSGSLIGAHYVLGGAGKDYCDESGAGGSSSTKTVFNIRGCNFDFGDGTIGVAKGRCSGSPADGLFYCSDDKEAFVTEDWGLGCAMGDSGYDIGNNGDFCCPSGSFCNVSESGGSFQCARRLENCFDQESEGACTNIGCIWLDVEGICSDGMRDYSCGYYDSEADCNTDTWKLGQIGIGTELCGTTMECNNETFSIPEGDCSCAWYDIAPAGQECQVKLIGVQMFYDPAGDPDRFECSNAYELGPCTGGEQSVTWFSNSVPLNGSFLSNNAIPNDCLAALNCVGGDTTRYCGEPIIKLPGFSLFAFFVSLFMIGAFYFMKE